MCRNVTEVRPNTATVLSLTGLQVLQTHTVHSLQMGAFKDHSNDYQAALLRAVQDRTEQSSADTLLILPLSAGLDSGILGSEEADGTN